jgi:hypothetical protein
MCPPVLAIVGALTTAASSIASGMAQSNAAQANADLQRRQALIETMAGQREANRKSEQVDQFTSRQRASYAASGVLIDGSPTDVIADTRREGQLDVAAIEWNARLKSGNLNHQAKISDMQAKQARTGGFMGALAPIIGLGAPGANGGPSAFTRLGGMFS